MPINPTVRIDWDGGKKINQALAKWSGSPTLRVGILEGATYSGEVGTNAKPGMKVANVAFWNEFGTKLHMAPIGKGGKMVPVRTPSRPFMRITVAEHKEEWSKAIVSMLRNGRTPSEALQALGMVAVSDFIDTIERGVAPPSSLQTIAYKLERGKQNPFTTLVDSGTMEQSISFEVIE